MGLYEDFIYVRSYSRWIPELKRRETYTETVDRFCNFIFNETRNCDKIPLKTKKRIRELILNLEIAPSMRLMWSAGENVKRDNIAAYNCAAMAMHSLECFGEMMYILLAGAGCGYSVEDRYVSKLPVIKKQKNRDPLHFVIPDTKLGWKQAIDFGVSAWVDGRDAVFGYERIRPAGTPLVISGGYASGSAALQRCLEFLRETFINAQERQLEPLEVSDINNEIGSSVICGGVRRSSEACLSDVDDLTMRDSKQGNFNPRRFMANISGVYRKKPNVLDFAQEFINMGRSGSGERGIYNLTAVRKRSPKRRDKTQIILTNPCFETTLRDMQCCNLSEAVVRAADDFDDMVNKIKAVSWLGAIQSTLSYFPVLRPEWTKNAEEERLMGVSITGLCDNMDLITPETLRHWRRIATKTAEEASKVLDINMPAAITLLKPSGTVSQRVDCSSGLHSRWAKFYIRRVRISTHDSLFKTMIDQGMPYELDKGNHDTAVFSFPIKSPEGAKLREQDTAIGQLEWYKMIVSNFCDQNASCTIYIKDEEWIETMDYVYRNWDTISGVSFFPYSNKKYDQPPYEEIDELTYKRMLNAMPDIDLTRLCEFEDTDNTEGASTLACSGATGCEI
jgi:ribonucleoside-triphosphate reductase (thioredoxin)